MCLVVDLVCWRQRLGRVAEYIMVVEISNKFLRSCKTSGEE